MERAFGYHTSRVHVLAYILWIGNYDKSKMVCHDCDVERCFNPKHLWQGTNRDNQLDAVKKGVFKRYCTKERRIAWGVKVGGYGNPMYGRRGKLAPAFGRTGKKHPMFGKHHTPKSKAKISETLRAMWVTRRKEQEV